MSEQNNINKQKKQPYLIICLGPTASGKGSLPDKIIKHMGLDKNHTKILIDDLVEKNPLYKSKISEFIEKSRKENKNNKTIINEFDDPSNNIIKLFKDAYNTARKKSDCNKGNTNTKNKTETCDEINDQKFKDAMANGENIVFETTGTSWPDWIFKEHNLQIFKHNYNIIMGWSVVEICELLKRNKSRAKESIENFLKNQTTNPPRLPNIRKDAYDSSLKRIIEVFENIDTDEKTKVCNEKKSEECVTIKLLVFDNNENNSKLLFESSEGIGHKKDVLEKGYKVENFNGCNSGQKAGGKYKNRKKSKRKTKKRSNRKRYRKSTIKK